LSTKQFFHHILDTRPDVFDSSVTFNLVNQDYEFTLENPDEGIKVTANLPFYGDDWARCCYTFHVLVSYEDIENQVASFWCHDGKKWDCKF
jgi:hypothetical protein